jgi:hypothetical protein
MRSCTRKSVYELCFKAAESAGVGPSSRDVGAQCSEACASRTPARSLLNRAFGLNNSFGEMRQDAKTLLKDKGHLTAQEFIMLVLDYGAISCYEAIPAGELEI